MIFSLCLPYSAFTKNQGNRGSGVGEGLAVVTGGAMVVGTITFPPGG